MMSSNFVDLTKDDIAENFDNHPEVVSNTSEINSWRKCINPFSNFQSCNTNSSEFIFDCTENLTRAPSTKYDEIMIEDKVKNDDLGDKVKQDEMTSSENDTKTDTNIQSYHVEFFNMMLIKSKESQYFDIFFNEEERNILLKFESLPENCQELYIRLYQRKKGWLRQSKIQYNSIDCPTCLKLLNEQGSIVLVIPLINAKMYLEVLKLLFFSRLDYFNSVF